MLYLTFNDSPSGIYKSQVIEAVELLNSLSEKPTRLIAFIPRQNFFKNRKQIKIWYHNSMAIPILPGLKFWQFSYFLFFGLNQFLKPAKIIGRGSMATYFVLRSKSKNQKVIYDGRGAVKAEIEEFGYFTGSMAKQVIEMERQSVLNSHFRISISNKLVSYWQTEYGYRLNNHQVIPCLAATQTSVQPINNSFFNTVEPILAYSGSTSPWQSFDLLLEKIENWLENTKGRVLLLTKSTQQVIDLQAKYPNKVLRLFVPENEVANYLTSCDYGLLIRHDKITNQVSSPVKFAEYLACGLKVIISEDLGDYSVMVHEHNLGIVLREDERIPKDLKRVTEPEKTKIKNFQSHNLSKEAFVESYKKIAQL
jgi:hypothetical protein